MKRFNVKQISSTIGLILAGIIGAIFLVEIAARLLGPPFNHQENILGSMHQCEQLVGWRGISNYSTMLNTDNQYLHRVSWNSQGMHDTEHQIKKENDVFRILILGDSFVQASEVKENQTNHQVLEDILTQNWPTGQIEVISGGILGWGPAQELLYFREQGQQYNPDLVLVLWVPANDLRNLLPDHVLTGSGVNCFAPYFVRCNKQFDPDPWFSVPGIEATYKDCSIGKKTLSRWLNTLYNYSTLYQRLAPALMVHQQDPASIPNFAPWNNQPNNQDVITYAYNLTADIYAQLANEAAQINAKTVFVIVPFRQAIYYEIDPGFRSGLIAQVPELADSNPTLPNQTFESLMSAKNLPVLDLYPAFKAHYQEGGEPLHWPSNFHWNVSGNKFAGELIAAWLIEQKLLEAE